MLQSLYKELSKCGHVTGCCGVMINENTPVSTQQRRAAIAYVLHGNCYVNLTNHCSLRCGFCPKFNKQWEVQGYPLRLAAEPSAAEVIAAIGDPSRYAEVVFCGLGEPTLRLSCLGAVARQMQKQGVQVRLNTDGLANWVYGRDVSSELAGYIDAVSISLNAQNAEIYDRHCRPPVSQAYQQVHDFIRCARRYIPDITLTVIDGLAGVDIPACKEIAHHYGVKFRRRELDKVG